MPGVADAAEQARSALAAAHRHRFNLRGWPKSAAVAASRAARASDVLADGEDTTLPAAERRSSSQGRMSAVADHEGRPTADPDSVPVTPAVAVATALGVDTVENTVATWRRAPLQVLARMHVLAVGAEADPSLVGRPRSAVVARRLDMLAQLVTGTTSAPAPVLAAIVHAELLSLRPFGSHDGVVARGAARLTTIATGLDPHGLGVPEIEWMRRPADYTSAIDGYSAGDASGVAEWIIFCCRAMEVGAAEAVKIADSFTS